MKYDKNNIDYYIADWSKRKLESNQIEFKDKIFDNIFQIEGISLWWFWKKYFFSYAMPKQVNIFKELEKQSSISLKQKIKLTSGSQLLRKFIYLNEKRKVKNLSSSSSNEASQKTDANEDNVDKDKILFLTYTNHILPDKKIYRLQSIVDELEKKQQETFVLFHNPLSNKDFKPLKDKNNIYSYCNDQLIHESKLLAKRLNEKWKKLGLKTKEKMLYSEKIDASLWPYLKYALNAFFSYELLFVLILHYGLAKKMLKQEKIKTVVVTAPHNIFEKTLLAATEKLGLKAVLVQHGWGLARASPEVFTGTKAAVFSEKIKDELIEVDFPEQDIVITGPVIFEGIEKYQESAKLKHHPPSIFVATAPFVESNYLDNDNYFARLEKTLRDIESFRARANIEHFKNLKTVIKMHPAERTNEKYKELVTKLNEEFKEDRIILIEKADKNEFYKLLSESDCFVNFGSTAAIEAMILYKPVITINFVEGLKDELFENPATLFSMYDGDISKLVEQALTDDQLKEKREQFMEKACYKVDGKAAERIANLISGM